MAMQFSVGQFFFCYYQKCKLRVIEFSAVHEKSETRKLYVDAMLIYR